MVIKELLKAQSRGVPGVAVAVRGKVGQLLKSDERTAGHLVGGGESRGSRFKTLLRGLGEGAHIENQAGMTSGLQPEARTTRGQRTGNTGKGPDR